MILALASALALANAPVKEQVLSGGFLVSKVIAPLRLPIPQDPVLSLLAQGKWQYPNSGEPINDWQGTVQTWTPAPKPNADGFIESELLQSAYYVVRTRSESRRIVLLKPQGASIAYVNGRAVAGDPYAFGQTRTPIVLESGENELLFVVGRGRVRPSLTEPTSPLLAGDDVTVPDIRLDKPQPKRIWVAVPVSNATEAPVTIRKIRVGGSDVPLTARLLPLQTRKLAMSLPLPKGFASNPVLTCAFVGASGEEAPFKLDFRTRKAGETYKTTFRSEVDGSVQYYAVRPALKESAANALVLSLHGASVEASGQADAYGPKTWTSVVCPTNRRPFGFDWEDWGRMDALEVLADAKRAIPHDDSRVSLTGHSMGGHGTWHVGTTYPDLFAAIAPSAGWVSFQTYGSGYKPEESGPIEQALADATQAGNTLARIKNLDGLGVYVLHGDADDTVPVTEARAMKAALSPWHQALGYHEEPGANHWWSAQKEPGASCVDWPGIFDLFAERRIPAPGETRRLTFSTASPNISATCSWATIEQQGAAFKESSIDFVVNPNLREIVGTTQNVQSLTLRSESAFGSAGKFTAVLDGQRLAGLVADGGSITLTKAGTGKNGQKPTWYRVASLPKNEKSPRQGSGFKNALRHRFVLVYGTAGTPKENAWMMNKARLDAESWLYRGNGDIEVFSDRDFDLEMAKTRDVLLIGNSEINSVWSKLLKGSPVKAAPGKISLGNKTLEGEDLCGLFVRPGPGSDTMIAAVAVTGLASMKLADRLPYLASGTAYPDYLIFRTDALLKGPKAALEAGWFNNQWGLD